MHSKNIAKGLALAFVAALAWTGCSDEPTTPPGNSGTTTYAELPAAIAKLNCAQIFSCCDAMERTDKLFDPPPATQAECDTQYAAFVKGLFGFIGTDTGIESGRLVFHGDRFDACVAKADKASCADFFENELLKADPDCDTFFEGTVALDGACGNNDECKDAGATCVGDSVDLGTGMLMLGTCKILPTEGQPCLQDEGCAEGLVCGTFGAADGKCGKPAAVGGACSTDPECASNYCDGATNQCATPAADGAACMSHNACTSGYCDDQGMCAPKKAGGEACVFGNECASDQCDANVCTPASTGPVCDGM